MAIKTDALILKENNNIGEADRFVTMLTREYGVVRAAARGAQRVKSRNSTATRMLTYAQVTLTRGRSTYVVTEAKPLRVFFDLHDMERLALGQYFCELCLVLAPREEPAEEALRVMLNSLHFLGEGSRDSRVIKAVTELRLLGGAGYAPDVDGCRRCGKTDGTMRLLPAEGVLYCEDCGSVAGSIAVPQTVCAALRGILQSPLERCYGIRLSEEERERLAAVSERLLLAQVNRGFQTLDFYHTIRRPQG